MAIFFGDFFNATLFMQELLDKSRQVDQAFEEPLTGGLVENAAPSAFGCPA